MERHAAHTTLPPDYRKFAAIILLNALLVGLETDRDLAGTYAGVFAATNAAIVIFFCAELLVRLAALGFRVDHFLRDGWNAFDVCVVAFSLLPGVGPFATVARIARVLRVVRLVSTSPSCA